MNIGTTQVNPARTTTSQDNAQIPVSNSPAFTTSDATANRLPPNPHTGGKYNANPVQTDANAIRAARADIIGFDLEKLLLAFGPVDQSRTSDLVNKLIQKFGVTDGFLDAISLVIANNSFPDAQAQMDKLIAAKNDYVRVRDNFSDTMHAILSGNNEIHTPDTINAILAIKSAAGAVVGSMTSYDMRIGPAALLPLVHNQLNPTSNPNHRSDTSATSTLFG